MSSGDESHHENEDGLSQGQKKRRLQRACDMCRRKKGESQNECLAASHAYLALAASSPLWVSQVCAIAVLGSLPHELL